MTTLSPSHTPASISLKQADAAQRRLNRFRGSPRCIPYFDGRLSGDEPAYRFAVYGFFPTDELFVEVTNGTIGCVESFRSCFKNHTEDERRKGIAGADLAEAFSVAVRLYRGLVSKQRTPWL